MAIFIRLLGLTLVRGKSPRATMFDRATDAVLALAPGQAPCCAMPATCWPHGRHGAAGLLSRAGAALKSAARRQMGVLEDAARRRQHVSARPTRTLASEICDLHPIAAPARCLRAPVAARTLPTHRALCRLPRVGSPAKMMPNDVARRVRAVGARLRSCPSRAQRVGDGRAAPGVLGTPGARAACRRGCGRGGGAAVGRVEESERWRAGACSLAGVRWGHVQAGARRGGHRRSCVGHVE